MFRGTICDVRAGDYLLRGSTVRVSAPVPRPIVRNSGPWGGIGAAPRRYGRDFAPPPRGACSIDLFDGSTCARLVPSRTSPGIGHQWRR